MSSLTDDGVDLTWNPVLETYLCDTAERCQSYSWAHKKAEGMYSYRTIFLDLPTIVIGAVNGFISVGSKQIFGPDENASLYIGLVSLFVSILSTINSYFSWGRRAEAHKMASNSYMKLCRFISVELNTKPRTERMTAKKILDFVKTTYDQLGETSPLVPPAISETFNKQFKNVPDFSRPEEFGELHAVHAYPVVKLDKEITVNILDECFSPKPEDFSGPPKLAISYPGPLETGARPEQHGMSHTTPQSSKEVHHGIKLGEQHEAKLHRLGGGNVAPSEKEPPGLSGLDE
jgi:hypothetical protein